MKNEHAFPHIHVEGSVLRVEGGLSKREYFAGLAMQAIVSSGIDNDSQTRFSEESIAEGAVLQADALIAELEKTNA